jgi:hypothetical protein
MALAHSPRIVTDGLVLCLDAANPKSYPGSGTTWSDLSGNGNNGTLTNGPTFNSGNGGNIIFDGTNDYVSTNLILSSPTTTATTFDIVFKNNSTSTFRGLIGASSYNETGFSIGFIGLSTMRNTYNASNLNFENQFSYNSSVISNGIFIFNGRNINIYRNSILSSSFTASFDAVQNSSGIQIGRNLQGGWGTSQVDIYSVKIYNRALTAAEIQQNFNATRSRYGI